MILCCIYLHYNAWDLMHPTTVERSESVLISIPKIRQVSLWRNPKHTASLSEVSGSSLWETLVNVCETFCSNRTSESMIAKEKVINVNFELCLRPFFFFWMYFDKNKSAQRESLRMFSSIICGTVPSRILSKQQQGVTT